ncbi:MAG: glycogen synthase GlgA [Proteobacteria bacterium]|nr:glycogen synthase GlgA [Pseudomonadota bacterium]
MSEDLKVWFLSSEVAPFAKTGGLADVAGSLPKALKGLGVDVRVGLPFYRAVKEGQFSPRPFLSGLEVPLGEDILRGDVLALRTEEDIPVFFFEREELFDRPNLYGSSVEDYYDNLERFAFFSRAALLFAKTVEFRFDVVHCHDWQTGLVPAYLKTLYRGDPFFSAAGSLFTIHNIGYQGLFPPQKLPVTGIPTAEYHPEGLEYWGKVSLLKAGLVYSDAITTVSPNYSKEIQTPEFGLGMEGVLLKRSADLHGILNGADYGVWDPTADQHIPARYSPQSTVAKKKNKVALLTEMGLDPAFRDRPVLGMISRLSAQKGCDLVVEIAEDILGLKAGLVVLGAGEEKYQTLLSGLAQKHQGRIAVKIGFDERLAHLIMAGADVLLIPSLYEPCGLTQMYALRYGTIPVVRATGGLEDTIVAYDRKTRKGNGFKFGPYEAKAFLRAIRQAIGFFKDREAWTRLMTNGMKEDFSWGHSAKRYIEIYRSLVRSQEPEARSRKPGARIVFSILDSGS